MHILCSIDCVALLLQLGKVSYYNSRWPLTSRQEKKELARTLGKSKVANAIRISYYTPKLVYRPQGRGPINRNIPIRGVIIDL